MKYLFDTDHVSILQRRSGLGYAALAARVASHPAADLAFSIVSFHEQVLGANSLINRSRTTADTIRGYELLVEILHGFRVSWCCHSMPQPFRSTTACASNECGSRQWISESLRPPCLGASPC